MKIQIKKSMVIDLNNSETDYVFLESEEKDAYNSDEWKKLNQKGNDEDMSSLSSNKELVEAKKSELINNLDDWIETCLIRNKLSPKSIDVSVSKEQNNVEKESSPVIIDQYDWKKEKNIKKWLEKKDKDLEEIESKSKSESKEKESKINLEEKSVNIAKKMK